jgi:hypothetical protein
VVTDSGCSTATCLGSATTANHHLTSLASPLCAYYQEGVVTGSWGENWFLRQKWWQ